MNWPFPGAGPTLGLFLVCLALAGIWLRERRQADALHRKLQLAAEAESDRLRLRISALQSGHDGSGQSIGTIDTAGATGRVTELEGELADLQARHNQARQTVAELEQRVASLAARESELEAALARSGQEANGRATLAKAAKKANPKKTNTRIKPGSKAAKPVKAGERTAKKASSNTAKKSKKAERASVAKSSSAKVKPAVDGSIDHRDDLQVFNGIGPAMEKALHEVGVRTWEQVAALGTTEADELVGRLPGGRSRVDRERWIEQAQTLIERYPLGETYDRPDRKSLARQGT